MHKEPVVIAMDLGGTNTRLALVTRQGKILTHRDLLTTAMPEQEVLINTLAEELSACGGEARSQGAEVKGVGMGVPGRVLSQEGVVAFSPNVPALNGCALVPALAPRVPWPLYLENDANLFALGEHWLGAGVGFADMLGITLGTGVGGGLILQGRLWTGASGAAAEIGHITVEPDGKKCHCGNRGCLETVASAAWAVAWVKEQLAQGAPSWLRELWDTDPEAIRGETLVVAAGYGDPLALRAFERAGRALGLAIAAVVHLLGLTRVVIGGRFARAWDLFYLSLKEELYRRLTMLPPDTVTLAPARLGDDAGLLGAARLAWDNLKETK